MALSIKPLADRVLLKPAEAEETTSSGIIIPDTAKEKPMKGEIVAVGPGTKDEKLTVKVGDSVNAGDTVIIVSAMKMESEYKVKKDRLIKEIKVKAGDTVTAHQALIVIE